MFPQLVQDLRDLRWAEQRRCAAAKKDRAGRQGLRGGTADQVYFPAKGIHVSRDEVLQTRVGIKVAVTAAPAAKGDVQVDGNGVHKNQDNTASPG